MAGKGCLVCGSPPDERTSIRTRIWTLRFCPTCYLLVKQGLSNLSMIREELEKRGISVGVPRAYRERAAGVRNEGTVQR